MSSENKITNNIFQIIKGISTAATLILVLILSGNATAYPVNDVVTFAVSDSSEIFAVVDKMPEVEGGLKKVYENIKYPPLAIRNRVEGKVFVKFIVDENGNVSKPEILKDIGSGCGEAVLKGIKNVKFKPGEQGGKRVKVYYTMPINFKLN